MDIEQNIYCLTQNSKLLLQVVLACMTLLCKLMTSVLYDLTAYIVYRSLSRNVHALVI